MNQKVRRPVKRNIIHDEDVDTSFANFLIGGDLAPTSGPSSGPSSSTFSSFVPKPFSKSPPSPLRFTNTSPERVPSPVPIRSPRRTPIVVDRDDEEDIPSPLVYENIQLSKKKSRITPEESIQPPTTTSTRSPSSVSTIPKPQVQCQTNVSSIPMPSLPLEGHVNDEEVTQWLVKTCTAALAPSARFIELLRNPSVRLVICNCTETYGTIETLCAWVKSSTRSAMRGLRVDCSNLSSPLVEMLNTLWIDATIIPVLEGLTVPMMGVLERLMRKTPAHRRIVIHTDDAYQSEPALRSLRRIPGAEVTKCVTVDWALASKCCNYIVRRYGLQWPQAVIRRLVNTSELDIRWIHNAIRFRAIRDDPTIMHTKDSHHVNETEKWAALLVVHTKTFKIAVEKIRWDAIRGRFEKIAPVHNQEPATWVDEGQTETTKSIVLKEKVGLFSMRKVEKVQKTFVRRKKEMMLFTISVDASRVEELMGIARELGVCVMDEQYLGHLPDRGRTMISTNMIERVPQHNSLTTLENIAEDLSQVDLLEGNIVHADRLSSYSDAVWRMSVGTHYRRCGYAITPKDVNRWTNMCVDTFIKAQMGFRNHTNIFKQIKETQHDHGANHEDAPFVQQLMWSIYVPLDYRHPMPTRDAALYAAVALKLYPPCPGDFSKRKEWVMTPVKRRDGRTLASWFSERCNYRYFDQVAWVMAWAALSSSEDVMGASNSTQLLSFIGNMIQSGLRQKDKVGEMVYEHTPRRWMADFKKMTWTPSSGEHNACPVDIATYSHSIYLAARKLI